MLLRAAMFVLVGAIALASARQAAYAENKGAAAPPPMAGANGGLLALAAIPDDYKLSMLIRTTLIALSQANQTGNYSVLRDLGTPQFQFMNNNARLAEIFSTVRARNLDFSPVLYFDPQLQRPRDGAGGLQGVWGISSVIWVVTCGLPRELRILGRLAAVRSTANRRGFSKRKRVFVVRA